MIEYFLWFCVLLNLSACAINTHAFFKYKKLYKKHHEVFEKDICLYFGRKKELFRQLGAYPAENGRMYIDLEGGLRLVIFEGEIEGWYIP